MGMLAKIRRMYFRDKVPCARSRGKPVYPVTPSDTGCARADARTRLSCPSRSQHPRSLQGTAGQLASGRQPPPQAGPTHRQGIVPVAAGTGLSGRLRAGGHFCQAMARSRWRSPARQAFIPLRFAPGEAFQFDWSCEYAIIAGIRRRLEVAHIKLAHSRAFLVVAYPRKPTRCCLTPMPGLRAFGGIPRRGIYDNMKTAVDKVGRGKERTVNARFLAMTGHYLFERSSANRAAGWEKGVVRRTCRTAAGNSGLAPTPATGPPWPTSMTGWPVNAERPGRTCATRTALTFTIWRRCWRMNNPPDAQPQPFDGYIEQPVRVSATALVHYQRSRYTCPPNWPTR